MMLKEKICSLLEEYLEAPEAWSDNVMIEIVPGSLECALYDGDEADTESSEKDYWPVMDLLRMSVDNPGEWLPDPEALSELLAAYN